MLVLAGEKAAKFYLAKSGMLEELEAILVLNPKYSDREGYFERRSGGNFTSGGSSYEINKQHQHANFIHALSDRLDEFRKIFNFDKIYLFAPRFMLKEIIHALPKEISKMVVWQGAGNYLDKHPFELIQRVAEDLEKNIVKQVSTEAMQLQKVTTIDN